MKVLNLKMHLVVVNLSLENVEKKVNAVNIMLIEDKFIIKVCVASFRLTLMNKMTNSNVLADVSGV